jgi:glycolate oxidase FAD binding subunit
VSVAELPAIARTQELVAERSWVRPTGGGSKPALSADGNLPLADLVGVTEYEPAEYTFTALAGTPVAAVERLLATNGQYLPFDPPLASAGATLGGTVASGLSGPGRFRYGGVRDFLLGVRFVDGAGRLLTGGGKVVKNAAGFDLPKLMVGSLGRYGVLVELTFKVFPRPEEHATLIVDLPDPHAALAAMQRLASSQLDLACLDLEPPGRLWLRLAGTAEALPRRLEQVQQFIGQPGEVRRGAAEGDTWEGAREFRWLPAEHDLIKLPLTPTQIPELERALQDFGAGESDKRPTTVPRRYSVAGHLAWLAWPRSLPAHELENLTAGLERTALALTGSWKDPLLGVRRGTEFARRLLSVLDPAGKFRPTP